MLFWFIRVVFHQEFDSNWKKYSRTCTKKKNQVKVGNKLKVNDQSNHVHSNWLIFFFLISDFHTKFLMNVAQMHKRLSRPPWEVQSSINFHIVILFLCMLIENGRLSYLKSWSLWRTRNFPLEIKYPNCSLKVTLLKTIKSRSKLFIFR